MIFYLWKQNEFIHYAYAIHSILISMEIEQWYLTWSAWLVFLNCLQFAILNMILFINNVCVWQLTVNQRFNFYVAFWSVRALGTYAVFKSVCLFCLDECGGGVKVQKINIWHCDHSVLRSILLNMFTYCWCHRCCSLLTALCSLWMKLWKCCDEYFRSFCMSNEKIPLSELSFSIYIGYWTYHQANCWIEICNRID